MGALEYLIFGVLSVFYILTFRERSVILGVKTHLASTKILCLRCSQVRWRGRSLLGSISLCTNNYSFSDGPNTFVLYGQGMFFSQVGLADGCVPMPAGCLWGTGWRGIEGTCQMCSCGSEPGPGMIPLTGVSRGISCYPWFPRPRRAYGHVCTESGACGHHMHGLWEWGEVVTMTPNP